MCLSFLISVCCFSYKHEKNALIVSVVRCRDLPAKDPNLGSSDPYVKLQLLPDKQHKVKTRVLRKTRNPVYDEDFTFYGINFNQLPSITLHFVVLSFDRYSRDDIIGEVFCPLNSVDINQAETQQIALCREIQPRSLKVSLNMLVFEEFNRRIHQKRKFVQCICRTNLRF